LIKNAEVGFRREEFKQGKIYEINEGDLVGFYLEMNNYDKYWVQAIYFAANSGITQYFPSAKYMGSNEINFSLQPCLNEDTVVEKLGFFMQTPTLESVFIPPNKKEIYQVLPLELVLLFRLNPESEKLINFDFSFLENKKEVGEEIIARPAEEQTIEKELAEKLFVAHCKFKKIPSESGKGGTK